MDRTTRQKQCVSKWIKCGGKGTLQACTGFGKTRVALTIIQSLVKVNPDSFTIIVVPTEMLKDQWMEELIKWHLFEHCQIEIINSVINKEWTCDLLVIDEAHLMASETFKRVFDVIKYKMILCLTATLERLDGKEIIIKKFAPVYDTIMLQEAEENKWVSPHKEYVVLLDVDLTSYKEIDRKFNSYFAYFNWDFDIAMNCVKDWEFRNKYAKQMGLAPKDVLAMAMDWNRCMRKRKEFIMSHPKKIEVCKKILEARKDKKCITFSATIKDSEAIGIGEVIHSKKSKAKNKEIIKKFNEATSGVLCTSKAADQGADISGLSVAVIMSTDSSKIRKTQRIGRTIRFEEGKTAELFTLIIKGTQEWKWFQNSNTTKTIVINESQLNDILVGKSIETREREIEFDTQFRF